MILELFPSNTQNTVQIWKAKQKPVKNDKTGEKLGDLNLKKTKLLTTKMAEKKKRWKITISIFFKWRENGKNVEGELKKKSAENNIKIPESF